MVEPDPYAVLGVSVDASVPEITRAYRQLARQLHPDVTGDPAANERFAALTLAYERVLAAAASRPTGAVPIPVRRIRPAASPPLVVGPERVAPLRPRRRHDDG
jgi:hypothetical protein